MNQSTTFHRCIIAIYTVAFAFLLPLKSVDAFVPTTVQQKQLFQTSHSMAGFMDEVGKFFDGFGNNDNKPVDAEIVEEIDGVYAGSKRIITIPGEHSHSEPSPSTCDTV